LTPPPHPRQDQCRDIDIVAGAHEAMGADVWPCGIVVVLVAVVFVVVVAVVVVVFVVVVVVVW
jgi:hypothetical protein